VAQAGKEIIVVERGFGTAEVDTCGSMHGQRGRLDYRPKYIRRDMQEETEEDGRRGKVV
jgi:hypothetical protein